MTEFVTIIKKYGVTGILVVWVYSLQQEVKEMRAMLVDCYEVQIRHGNATDSNITPQKMYAILPDEKNNKRHAKA